MTDQGAGMSPLGHMPELAFGSSPDGSAVTISEVPLLGYVGLRGDPADVGFVRGVESALGCPLPTRPGRAVTSDICTAYPLGPDEWLIRTHHGEQTRLIDSLDSRLGGLHYSATDLTGGLTTIALGGPKARDTLTRGCTLDLDPSVFGKGSCAQTLVAKTSALICVVGDAPSYEIIVRRSFAEYAALWLSDAAVQFRG